MSSMRFLGKILHVTKTAFYKSMTDRKNIVLLLIIGFILDNGVAKFVSNTQKVNSSIYFGEGFIMCSNHWYYIVLLMFGFIFVMTDLPRLNHSQIFIIYRAGKIGWFIGELCNIIIYSLVYVLILLCGSIICCSRYSYIDNKWSEFTLNYEMLKLNIVSDSNRYIDYSIFKYYQPREALIHSFFLVWLCLIIMGMTILLFAILDKKKIAIIYNMIMILFVMIFFRYHARIMWLSPFCHAMIGLHNTFIYKRYSVSLAWSYIYDFIMINTLMITSILCLRKKSF